MGSGITSHGIRDQKGGIWDHSPAIRDHKPWDQGSEGWVIWDHRPGIRDQKPWDQGSEGWDLGSQPRDQGSKGWDQGSEGWDLGSQPSDQGSQLQAMGSGSGDFRGIRDQAVQLLWDQGPKFVTLSGSRIRNLGTKMGSEMERNIPRLYHPVYLDC